MKKNILIFLSTILTLSCTHEKKTIEFKKMANFDLGNLTKKTATLHGVAVFTNLTEEEFTMKDLVLDFTVDGKDIGTIVIKTQKIIHAKSEFSIPVAYTYDTKTIIEQDADPSSTYAVELLGNLTTKNQKEEELLTDVKFATTYEYMSSKEKRSERRAARKSKTDDVTAAEPAVEEQPIDKKEERRKRREERRAKRNN